MFIGILLESLKNSAVITGLVVLMMALVECLEIWSHGRLQGRMKGRGIAQILLSSLLGAIPGCAGGYAAVSLYTHGMLSFGALVAMLIATSGDESFAMFAMFPGKAAVITAVIFVTAVLCGWITDLVLKGRRPAVSCYDVPASEVSARGWKGISERVWKHVILHHAPKVFAWTFGTLLLLGFALNYLDIESWISDNTALMIVLAALVGIIPQSGPHFIFVSLFAGGVIPAPVLLASCISQDGHASLPLLAESKKSFLAAKAINVVVAIAVGFAALLCSPSIHGRPLLPGPGEYVSQQLLDSTGVESWFQASPIPDEVFESMQGKSFKAECTVSRDELRYLKVLHKDTLGRSIVGEMVVNKAVADDVLEILRQLYEAGYPIERMRLIDVYDADDETSMRANNSSSFNFRFISHTDKVSKHGAGLAVDINPLYNPYFKTLADGTKVIEPATAEAYLDRDASFPYKITADDLCCKLFKQHGFSWGGDWKSCKDYQHFEK